MFCFCFLTVRKFIFTINAGDETLSLFVIDPTNPTHPSLVGTPAPTLGETPISVAYSSRVKTGQLCHLYPFPNPFLTICQHAFSTPVKSPVSPATPSTKIKALQLSAASAHSPKQRTQTPRLPQRDRSFSGQTSSSTPPQQPSL